MADAWRNEMASDPTTTDMATRGFVIIAGGKVDGWTHALDNPRSHVPGCIAVGAGQVYVSRGGDDGRGATEWVPWSPNMEMRWGQPENWATEKAAADELDRLHGTLTKAELDQLESRLRLRANIKGWTGDPLRQPAADVLLEIKYIISRRLPP
ncbi:MAG: hypothetical protein Q7S40_29465 [Opitutaceae bacterium]|nr:hypothetical protein [Opitutaceae bacterium]